MADFFFGFDTSVANSSLEGGLDCLLEEDDLGEEEEYDALNDETFGSEATIGDWEKHHEKLAEITESSRLQNQNSFSKKNGIDADIEDSLSHLVLDEKEEVVPHPGVWGSPYNLSSPKPQSQHPPPLSTSLANVCTVEELEKGLIGSRPPPGLVKPPQVQQAQQQKTDGPTLFDALAINDKLQINGLPPQWFPPGLGIPMPAVVLSPNMRFPHPQFMQHPRLLPNQTRNMIRYPLPPHLVLPHTAQKQPIPPGSFCGTFPQSAHANLRPPTFLRPDHGMIPPFPGGQTTYQQQQHSFTHSASQRNQSRLPFHHSEQQGNHQPFFKNNQYLYRNHDRNNQRHHHYHQHYHGSSETNNSGEYDEYAGLMTNREKQWLINIQLLQLNTGEPYIDDYYYTVFCDRQNKKHANHEQKEKHNNNNNNNGYHKDLRERERDREREQSHHVLSKVVYTPIQFENSLGKLQCLTIIAPRKIIDMDVVPNSDSHASVQLQQKDTKKTRQLLLEIERLYIIQLKLEDLGNPLATAINRSEQQKQGRENEGTGQNAGPELINTILTSLLQLTQDDKLASMLSIRKGKTLLLRFLPHINVTEYHSQLEELWYRIFRGLAIIGRRDAHLLMSLYPDFQRWLATVRDFGTLLRLAGALSDSVSQPVKNNSLAFSLSNKFGVSVIASILEQAEKLYPSDESLSSEWSNFITNIVETIGDAPPCVAPCQPIAPNTLNQHLNRISNLKIERYTTLELLLTEANPSR